MNNTVSRLTLTRFTLIATLAFFLAGAMSAGAQDKFAVQPFSEHSLAELEAMHQGRQFVLVLWSITCAPCFAELQMISEELSLQPDLAVVLVSTDGSADSADVLWALEDHDVPLHRAWQFEGDFAEKLRYRIDPEWFGELPRSYFYDAAGNRKGQSGVISREQLLAWLEKSLSEHRLPCTAFQPYTGTEHVAQAER